MHAQTEVIVETRTGPVTGSTQEGITRFLGVPFAETSGRFAPPEPPSAWTAVRPSETYGPAPVQPAAPYLDKDTRYSEDCLNLNVWSPDIEGQLPVLVWVYGGGFEGGSNSVPWTDGGVLASKGPMVVVSVNYRVGSLGFSYLADLGEPFNHAANLGVQDVIAALRWVRENIARFGGDPGTVTCVGESAGGFIGAALAAAPEAAGLFHRLALFSGGASRIVPLETATRQARHLLAALEAEAEPARLLSLDSREILAAQSSFISSDIGLRNGTKPQALGVVLDTRTPNGVLQAHPMSVFASGAAKHIPLLVSSTQHEIAAFRQADPARFDPHSLEDLKTQIEQWGIPGDRLADLIHRYSSESFDPGDIKERMLTDWIYRLPAVRLARAHAAAGGASFLALVDGSVDSPAFHGCDVAPIFGTTAPATRSAPEEQRDRAITEAVIRFVTTSDPGLTRMPSAALTAATFGEGNVDATAEYARVLENWEGIERP